MKKNAFRNFFQKWENRRKIAHNNFSDKNILVEIFLLKIFAKNIFLSIFYKKVKCEKKDFDKNGPDEIFGWKSNNIYIKAIFMTHFQFFLLNFQNLF